MSEAVVDGCAGPGGWDVAARSLGLDPLGVEFDDAACATREAAGLRTLQGDVTKIDPMQFAPVRGLIFSPPCQAFSMAGKGAGRRAIEAYRDAIRAMAEGHEINVAALDEACGDPRAHVVLEPLRWALALRPEWIALEQVEPVLALWEEIAMALRRHGWMTWTGVLSAECYGTPQTRKRAILMASTVKQPVCPPASHQRYVAPRAKAKQEASLFDAPEPERLVLPEDRELRPWVSMAQALGWGMTARPSVTVASGGENRYGAKPLGGGSGSGTTLAREQQDGAWDPRDRVGFPRRAESDTGWDADTAPTFEGDNGVEYRERDLREASEPAFAVTEKSRSWQRWTDRRPAPTMVGGRRSDEGMIVGRQLPPGTGRNVGGWNWTDDRPAEHSRIARHRRSDRLAVANDGRDNSQMIPRSGGEASDGARAVRVTIQEASVLQGMPADYPYQGNRTAQYRQVGDLIPPQVARAVLEGLL